jgi:hypothetical protein
VLKLSGTVRTCTKGNNLGVGLGVGLGILGEKIEKLAVGEVTY